MNSFLSPATRWLLRMTAVSMAVISGLSSCSEKHQNAERSERIEVYVSEDMEEPVNAFCVDVRGGEQKIRVKSNVAFTAKWQDSEASPWITVKDITEADGYSVVTLEVKRRGNSYPYYTRRSGTLILASEDATLNFNRFITVHQGANARVSSNMEWLIYGSKDPRISEGETSIDEWSNSQKDRNYGSTRIEGESVTHCYGKNGYLRLGDDKGHGADLISPSQAEFHADSLLMVSFAATAFTDYFTGEKDANKLRVEVTGGGVIRDFAEAGKTSIDFEVPYYDVNADNVAAKLFDDAAYLVFVASTPTNPITANTKIRLISGSLTAPFEKNNRIYIDNFYIRNLTDVDQPYFEQNGGSGLDRILGKNEEEQ